MTWLAFALLALLALLVAILLGFAGALLLAFLGAVLLLTLLFYAIRWYELGRMPEARARLREVSWRALWQFALEYLAQLGTLALWLADAATSAYRRWRPRVGGAAGGAAGGRPAILVHGLGMRGLTLWPLGVRLRWAGRREVRYFTYGQPARDIPGYAEQLKEAVEAALRESGSERADLFCHSMGGLVARYYASFLGGAERIAHLVTLGTPHGGSGLWCFALTPRGLDLKPGSPLLQRLEQAGAPPGVRSIAVHSPFDQFVLPAELARWDAPGVENIEVPGVGHNRLVWNGEVFRRVWERMEGGAAGA